MKKALTTIIMAFVAVLAFAELHPIEKMPVDRSMTDCVKFAQRIGYSKIVCDSVDGDGWRVWVAKNPTDKSVCKFKGYDDIVITMWIEWQKPALMPKKLHDPIEGGDFTFGKYKNNYVYNRNGGNFLDPYDPDYLEPEER